jgi:hypothetical protein
LAAEFRAIWFRISRARLVGGVTAAATVAVVVVVLLMSSPPSAKKDPAVGGSTPVLIGESPDALAGASRFPAL